MTQRHLWKTIAKTRAVAGEQGNSVIVENKGNE